MKIFIEILFIGIGLAMDAFAVAVCKGLSMKKVNKKHAVIIALFFGGFQGIMPFIGWALGRSFEQYIKSVDHWIAFVLLGIIGGKMIYDALKETTEAIVSENETKLDIKELLVLAIATSIDALAVGITFAFLEYPIGEAVAVIGVTTFVISLIGVYIGNLFGSKYEKKAELAGGTVLILIGLKILLEHLEIISF